MIVTHSPVILAEIQAPVLAGSVGAALTLVARQCGFKFQWCRTPLAHHTHTSPVPRIGGLAVFAAIAIAWAMLESVLGHSAWLSVSPILLASFPVLLVGAYDDLRHASPKAKVLAQLAGAALLIFSQWLLTGSVTAYDLLIVAPWLVIATNSFNLIDGVDGLAAGTAVIIAAGLALINIAAGDFALAVLTMITAAACLGFLPFNLSGARIFLGDSGSLTLGFILSAVALQTPHRSWFPWAAIVLFGYPLTETTLSIVRRALKGRSIFRPDREHMHHKLRHAGFSSGQTAFVLLLVALAFAGLGVMLGLGASHPICVGSACVLFLAVAKSFGYLRTRTLRLFHRRLALLRQPPQEELPDIAGYLPFK
jgi:UDP-GlcNAc:undecaprenyl-phosphate/decaprenyl-phosphate GlcNAc-1-phosphate transferase